MINQVEVIKHEPIGLSKEQVIAEFNNLASWEKQEVYDEMYYELCREKRHLRMESDKDLRDELERRGYTVIA